MPAWAPRPVPTMMAVGVASPSAHGQAMMSTATDVYRACDSRVSAGARSNQATNVTTARHRTTGHEDAADPVGQPLDRGLRPLGLLDQPDDLLEDGVRPDLGGPEAERAGRVERRRRSRGRPAFLATGSGSPGQHRSRRRSTSRPRPRRPPAPSRPAGRGPGRRRATSSMGTSCSRPSRSTRAVRGLRPDEGLDGPAGAGRWPAPGAGCRAG